MMNNSMEKQPTPEETAEAKQQFEASYMGRMCPYLTSAGMRTTGSPLVGAMGAPLGGPPEMEATGCQGPRCMLFVGVRNEKGLAVAGSCAIALLPHGMEQLRSANLNIAEKFIGNYKIKPINS